MTTRKKVTLALVGFVALIVLIIGGLTALLLYNSSPPPKKDSQAAEAPGAPKPPSAKNTVKSACDLLDDKLAAKVIGEGAVKNNKLVAFTTLEYSSLSCEYSVGSKKANLILYRYATEALATSNQAKVQKQEQVASADGKTTGTQPRQSVVSANGKAVLSASVTDNGQYDAQKSQLLLEEARKKL
ncbi:MAG TPA: hypothetical protein VMR98_00790 [Candidatus Polarisedimenticolaceae bacterium]|nr:hypothetical protein [Candidatus Polarisedimenticolaceae bacterium]